MCILDVYHYTCTHSQDAIDIDKCPQAEENNLPRCSDLTERPVQIPDTCPDCYNTSDEQHDADFAATLAASKEDYQQQVHGYAAFDNSDDELDMIERLKEMSVRDDELYAQEMTRRLQEESLREWQQQSHPMDNWSQRAKGYDDEEEDVDDSPAPYRVPAPIRSGLSASRKYGYKDEEEDVRRPEDRHVPARTHPDQPRGGYGGPMGHPPGAYLPPQGHASSGSGPPTGRGKGRADATPTRSRGDFDRSREAPAIHPQTGRHSSSGEQDFRQPPQQGRPPVPRSGSSFASQATRPHPGPSVPSPRPVAAASSNLSSAVSTPIQARPSSPPPPAKNENAAAAARARWQRNYPQVAKPPVTPKAVIAESSAATSVPASWTNRAAQAALASDDSEAVTGAQNMRTRLARRDVPQSRGGPSIRGGPSQIRPEPSQTRPGPSQVRPGPSRQPVRAEALSPSGSRPGNSPFDPPMSPPQRSIGGINIKPLAEVRKEQMKQARPQITAVAKAEGISDAEVKNEFDTTAKEGESSDEEPTPPPSPNTLRLKRLAMYGKRPATGDGA